MCLLLFVNPLSIMLFDLLRMLDSSLVDTLIDFMPNGQCSYRVINQSALSPPKNLITDNNKIASDAKQEQISS